VRMLVAEVCRLQGHDVVEAGTGAQAIELGRSAQPDLVLVDWVLPDISGTEVIRELRRQGVVSPMVMLTGRSTRMDEVVGLEVGADDYITKPFDSRILAARINAHLRRSALAETGGGREGVLSIGALQIDNAARRVKVGEDEITLTMTEFNLLAVLAANPERVLTRAQLRDKVWGYPHDLDDHSVDPHVQRLRRKLSERSNTGVSLEAVPGLSRGLVLVGAREDDRELLAAGAAGDIGEADAVAQDAGELDQDGVAGRMAEAVVDELETVEVEQEHGDQAVPFAFGAGQGL